MHTCISATIPPWSRCGSWARLASLPPPSVEGGGRRGGGGGREGWGMEGRRRLKNESTVPFTGSPYPGFEPGLS